MGKPSADKGVLEEKLLVYEDQGKRVAIIPETSDWDAWLETATSFTFRDEAGTMTVHKVRAGNGRGGWYWRAYRFQAGRTFRSYLGLASNLTLAALSEANRSLAARAAGNETSISPSRTRSRSSASAPADPATPLTLVTTKYTLPRLPMQHVPRERLLTLLERGAGGPLTLVCAPAGSGKTTLLASWARTTTMPVAWLSLEPADSDLARFLAYLLAALRTLDACVAQKAGAFLQPGAVVAHTEKFLTELTNDLTSLLTIDTALVLDDYQALESEATQMALLFLLEHLPQRLHLVLGTRVDPPLPLARLRARGQVSEIRADLLRFADTEIQHFLQEMDLPLEPRVLATLEERTEGWIAGIQLAALALRGRADHETFLRGFRGNNRLLLEYMSEEILAHQEPLVRSFLLQTSILEHLSGSLCDAVTASTGSQTLLEELRKANLFVSALDETGAWYRYHALFAEGLRHLLQEEKPASVQELHRRACIWYEAHGILIEACEHALQARDFRRALPLLERQVNELVGRGHLSLLRRWLSQLPAEIITGSPGLSMAAQWLLYLETSLSGSSPSLKQLDNTAPQLIPEPIAEPEHTKWLEARANMNFMQLIMALDEHNLPKAREIAQQTLQELPEDATRLRKLALLGLHIIQAEEYLTLGEIASAEQVLIEAGTLAIPPDYHYLHMIAIGSLARMYEIQGELAKSAHLHRQLLHLLRADPQSNSAMLAWTAQEYASLLLEWNRLDEAEETIQLALDGCQQAEMKELALLCYPTRIWIHQARNQDDEALTLLQELEDTFSSSHASTPVLEMVLGLGAEIRTRLLLRLGKEREALRCSDQMGLHYDDPLPAQIDDTRFTGYMTLARVLIAQGRQTPREAHIAQALSLLARFCTLSEQQKNTRRLIEVLILLALAQQARGDTRTALISLERAVYLAEPGGFVRIFANEGAPLARMLARLSAPATYVHMLLAASSADERPASAVEARQTPLPMREPLSAREKEVLSELAAGASNQEIAARLVIAPNTAKRHVKHILAKLAVANRAQAVTRAHELDLL
jgi:LuxR family maltose regulon positive regulatory protein